MTERNPTRSVRIGKIDVGGGAPIVVQSMCATKTTDIDATVSDIGAYPVLQQVPIIQIDSDFSHNPSAYESPNKIAFIFFL